VDKNERRKFKMPIFIRALRLPFASASALGFIFGSFIQREKFDFLNFLLGLLAAVSTHLAANLINDFADSRSGADWQDKNSYNFFGGSKLIQEGKLSEGFYFKTSLVFSALALFCVLALWLRLGKISCLFYYLIILFLGWSYSQKPLALSYCRLGELVIFLLFGPALVMGGYFIQTGIFPDLTSFLLSLPAGIFTVNILFANEIPDYPDDSKCKKLNWVSCCGQSKAYILYFILCILGFGAIILNISIGNLSKFALLTLIAAIPALKAGIILKQDYKDKLKLINSSKLTIAVHTLVSVILIIAILL